MCIILLFCGIWLDLIVLKILYSVDVWLLKFCLLVWYVLLINGVIWVVVVVVFFVFKVGVNVLMIIGVILVVIVVLRFCGIMVFCKVINGLICVKFENFFVLILYMLIESLNLFVNKFLYLNLRVLFIVIVVLLVGISLLRRVLFLKVFIFINVFVNLVGVYLLVKNCWINGVRLVVCGFVFRVGINLVKIVLFIVLKGIVNGKFGVLNGKLGIFGMVILIIGLLLNLCSLCCFVN